MLLVINRHDNSVGRATGFHSQGCEFKPHQGQKWFIIFMYNMKSKKLSNKFISRKIKKFRPQNTAKPLKKSLNQKIKKSKKKTSRLGRHFKAHTFLTRLSP